MPLLSIIVPVYNVEPYLAECLDSLLAQTLKDMEIICVNDGSTDASGTILARYAEQHPDVIKVITQTNKGLSAARNAGMAVAQGIFTAFCDSDDTVIPHAYQTALACFTDDVDSVCFGTETFYEPDTLSYPALARLKRSYAETFDLHSDNPAGEKKHISFNEILSLNCCVWNKIYRTEALKKIRLTFREYRSQEDNLFHCCFFALAPNTYLLPEKLYRYRIRSNSIMGNIRNKSSHSTNLILILRDMADFYHSHNILPDHAKDFVSFCESFCASAWLVIAPHEQSHAVYEIITLFKEYKLPLPSPKSLCGCAIKGTYTIHWGHNKIAKYSLKAVWQLIYSWNKILAAFPFNEKRKEILRSAYRLARLNIKELK